MPGNLAFSVLKFACYGNYLLKNLIYSVLVADLFWSGVILTKTYTAPGRSVVTVALSQVLTELFLFPILQY